MTKEQLLAKLKKLEQENNNLNSLLHEAVTENEHLKSKLDKAENKNSIFPENNIEGYFYLSHDLSIKTANNKAAELLGFELNELCDKPFQSLIHESEHLEVQEIKNILLLAEKKYFELKFTKKDGSILHTIISSVAHLDQEGNCEKFFVVIYNHVELLKSMTSIQAIAEKDFLFDTIPVAIYSAPLDVNIDANFITGNIKRLTGFTSTEFLSDPKFWQDRLHPVDKKRVMKAFATERIDNELSIEYRWLCADGKYKWFFDHSIFSESNNKKEYIGVFFDITDKKNAELELQNSEISYKDLFNSVNEAIYIHKADGIFIDVNDGASKMYGYRREELVGMNPEMVSAPGKNDLEEVLRMMNECLSTGKSQQFEFWGMRKNGEIFPKDVIYNKGNYLGDEVIITTARDISDQKKNDLALKASEERFRKLLQNIDTVALYGYDFDGTVHYWNKGSEIFYGYTAKEAIGKNIFELIIQEDFVESVKSDIARMYKTQTPVPSSEIPKKHKNGTIVPVYSNHAIVQIPGREAELFCIDINLSDLYNYISETEQKNQQLEKLNAEKDKFFSIIAHDLRSPFNGFLGLTEIMAERLMMMTVNEIQRHASVMNVSANNLFTLLENLLEWTRMQKGVTAYQPEVFSLSKVVKESLKTISDVARNKDIEFEVNIPERTFVFADIHMIETICRNLISNAVKFTQRGGKIILNASLSENNEVEISVIDNGIGMSKELISKLFRIDVNPKRVGTEKEPSSGLGLLLCKEFVEKNGGKIIAQSEEGKGSTFTFTIPLFVSNKLENNSLNLIEGKRISQ